MGMQWVNRSNKKIKKNKITKTIYRTNITN